MIALSINWTTFWVLLGVWMFVLAGTVVFLMITSDDQAAEGGESTQIKDRPKRSHLRRVK